MSRSKLSSTVVGLVWLVSAVPVLGRAQAGAPAASQTGAGQQRSSNQGGSSAEVTTIRVRTNIVVVDVIVTDSKQNPIHGLEASDFTLTESGKTQQIRRMEEYKQLPASQTAKLPPPPKLPPGLFSNRPVAPANGPVNVLLLDYLNTPLDAQPYARQQLQDYLKKAPPGTRMAIFGLNQNLYELQGFTSDPEVLKKALNSKRGAPQSSVILTNPDQGGPQGNTTLSTTFESNALDADQQLANVERFEAHEAAFEQQIRVQATLGAFDQLAQYLVGIPGRKNLIWFSGSFPLSIEPNEDLQDPFDSVVRNDDEVRKTDNLLTRAQIAVYPVDARGVFNDPANSAVNGAAGIKPVNVGGNVVAGNNASQSASAQINFLQQTAQEHETMEQMAEDTGGKAFINNNNLTLAVQEAVSHGSNYYTLTYTPTNNVWDGRFRAIKIKVNRPGVKLSYRTGYYADDPNDRNRTIAGSAATAMSRPSTMTTAMLFGAPEPSAILMKTRIRPSAQPPDDKLASGNKTNPDPKANVNGPYKNYGIDLVPDAHSISCPKAADGVMHCAIEAASYVYNRDGILLVANNWHASYTLTPENYQNLMKNGMAIHQVISVPVKGDYHLRIAVHDLNSDRAGAIEVPVAAVKNLPPLDMPPPPAGASGSLKAPGAVVTQEPKTPDAAGTPAATPATTPPSTTKAPQ